MGITTTTQMMRWPLRHGTVQARQEQEEVTCREWRPGQGHVTLDH